MVRMLLSLSIAFKQEDGVPRLKCQRDTGMQPDLPLLSLKTSNTLVSAEDLTNCCVPDIRMN